MLHILWLFWTHDVSLCSHTCPQEFILHKALRLNLLNTTPTAQDSHPTQNEVLVPYDGMQAFYKLALSSLSHPTCNFNLLPPSTDYLRSFSHQVSPSLGSPPLPLQDTSALKMFSKTLSLVILSLEYFSPESPKFHSFRWFNSLLKCHPISQRLSLTILSNK